MYKISIKRYDGNHLHLKKVLFTNTELLLSIIKSICGSKKKISKKKKKQKTNQRKWKDENYFSEPPKGSLAVFISYFLSNAVVLHPKISKFIDPKLQKIYLYIQSIIFIHSR